MPTSKTVKRTSGGSHSGPVLYQKLSSERMVSVNGKTPDFAHSGEGVAHVDRSGGSSEGWRQSRMTPKGGPKLTESRRKG